MSSFDGYTRDITTGSAALSLGNSGLRNTGLWPSTSQWANAEYEYFGNYDQANSPASAHSIPHAHSTHAHTLITALENFMLPIIYAHIPAVDNPDFGRPQLRPEAKKLLYALEEFVSILVRPRHGANSNEERPEEEEARRNRNRLDRNSTARAIPIARDVAVTPPLLKRALEEARHHVFNKMPIRLLAFNWDGSGMKLIERSAIWDRISTTMVVNFNYDEIQSDIRSFIINHHSQSDAENQSIENFVSTNTRYAILSHTWLRETPGEVTYANWITGELDKSSAGYQKLANFCRVAAMDYQVSLGWMDTICINKESSSELDESIRSMCKWYHDAYVCVTYLMQTVNIQDMHSDPWFTRGWTLQELLSPRYIKFYGANWERFAPVSLSPTHSDPDSDTRNRAIQREIQMATTISPNEVHLFHASVQNIRISRKMQWAANRRVTREEDAAYSLMGIFDVGITIAYGEGFDRAFFRLIKEILSSSNEDVLDIVNWASGSQPPPSFSHTSVSSLIPSSPNQYLWRTEKPLYWPSLTEPITLTHLGLHLPVLLMNAISVDPASPDASFIPYGDYFSTVSIDVFKLPGVTRRYQPSQEYNVLERSEPFPTAHRCGWNATKTRFQLAFGVLNFQERENSIELSENSSCLAICLYFFDNCVKRISTSQVVIFDLKKRLRPQGQEGSTSVIIPKIELERHGIAFRRLYL